MDASSQELGWLIQYSDWAMGWTTGIQFPTGAEIISLRHRSQTGSAVHPASYPTGTGGSFRRNKADHSPPSGTEVMNA